MASFSSRGGPGQTLGVSKPDITAPGVQILAGDTPAPRTAEGGPPGRAVPGDRRAPRCPARTSRARRRCSGICTPTWTPGQIKSALMTTARTAGVVKEDGVTPADAFDDGSGRVDLRKAGDPGLTFDATGADFLAWEDELYRVNQPSVYHPSIPGVVTVSRTVRSVLGSRSDWRITVSSPSDFKITVVSSIIVNARSTRTFNITMDANRVPLGQTRFATIKLTQTRGGKSCPAHPGHHRPGPGADHVHQAVRADHSGQQPEDDLHPDGDEPDIRERHLSDQGHPAEPAPPHQEQRRRRDTQQQQRHRGSWHSACR